MEQLKIEVWANWIPDGLPRLMGYLYASLSRGKEVFSFEYKDDWLESKHAEIIDPALGLYSGAQYVPKDQINFGLFLDSSPDRWGRVLMQRREAVLAKKEGRTVRNLLESDYLLGVYDGHRQGALRFKLDSNGPFLNDDQDLASPPWTSLKELEHAAWEIEKDQSELKPQYSKWLNLLLAPGASLGGARPKASVLDKTKELWIAKFPSSNDTFNVGAWEYIINRLATKAGLNVAKAKIDRFANKYHTFLSKRFDRRQNGYRLHFASAMTLLQYTDGADSNFGASYLELVSFIRQYGSRPSIDLLELWKRIAFFVCVSNTDDHLRNHGFILTESGWSLAPAFDINPNPYGGGLTLNISETDNSQNLGLVSAVSEDFGVSAFLRKSVLNDIKSAIQTWREEANLLKIPREEQERMSSAFSLIA